MDNPNDKKINRDSRLEKLALKTTGYIGSSYSLAIHTILFMGIFSLQWFGFGFDQIMLILTTAVSLEAIYLSIFIQMTVNYQASRLAEVSEEVEDISEDVEEISKDIDTIQEDVEDIGEEIEKDDQEHDTHHSSHREKIQHIEVILTELLQEVHNLKDKKE